ncbi:autotransporter outer membrane beta-barrel domain-containing protein [Providencia rettgeri]
MSKNAFVVVSELASSKGKKAATVVALSALSPLVSVPAFADSCSEIQTAESCIIVESEKELNGTSVTAKEGLVVHGDTTGTILTGSENPNGNGSQFDDGSRYDAATELVLDGAKANGTTINAGGVQIVDGGEAKNSTVNYHGSLAVYRGSVTNSTVGTNDAASGLRTNEAYITVKGDNSSADNTTINNGGVLSLSEGALATNTTINAGGRLELSVIDDNSDQTDTSSIGTTTAEGVTINKDGILALDAGTQATDVTVNKGGLIWAEEGATLEKVTNIGADLIASNAILNGTNTFKQQGTLTVGGDVSADIIELYNSNITFANPTAPETTRNRDYAFTPGNLEVATLKGEGNNNITMRIDAASGDHDTLTVTDEVSGQFNVKLDGSGSEMNAAAFESPFINAKGSQADTFSGSTDLGAYNYSLYQDGDVWKLQRSGNLSASASNAMMLANVTPTVWASELSVLRNRLGELRTNKDDNGVWLKYITARNRINNNQISYKQDMNGFVLGGDRKINVSEGNLYLGSQFSYSYSSLNAQESDGNVKSYSVGLYATWLHDSGYYMDGVLKGNRFFSNNNAHFNQGKTNASDSTNGIGFSVEAGKKINIETYQIEPYVQLAGFQGQKTSYTFDNGLNVNANSTRSLKGEIGTTLGKEFDLASGGSVTPYVRLAVSQEFVKNNDVTINHSERFTNDMSGVTGKYGVGVNTKIVDNLDAYGEFNYAKGNKLETPYSGTVGVRYSF